MTVEVFAGGACGQPPRWQVILPCDQAGHTAISNNGRPDLDPAAADEEPGPERHPRHLGQREVRAREPAQADAAKVPLRGEVRIDFDGDGLRLKADRTFVIPFETVRKLTSSVSD